MKYKLIYLALASSALVACNSSETINTPEVSFSQSCVGLTCNFTSHVDEDIETKMSFVHSHKRKDFDKNYEINYKWNLGQDNGPIGSYQNDTSETSPNPIFKFATFGEHDVKLTVTVNGVTQDGGIVKEQAVSTALPQVSFSYYCNNKICSFLADVSQDGKLVRASSVVETSYQWNIQDVDPNGSYVNGSSSTDQNPSFAFSQSGEFDNISVTATPEGYGPSTESKTIYTESSSSPQANFIFNCEEMICYVDGSSSTAGEGATISDETGYQWSTSLGASVSDQGHPKAKLDFMAPSGSVTIVLTVTNSDNKTATTSKKILDSIALKPIAQFTIIGCQDKTCDLDASSSDPRMGRIVAYWWNTTAGGGDLTSSGTPYASVTYQDLSGPSGFPITLDVGNSFYKVSDKVTHNTPQIS